MKYFSLLMFFTLISISANLYARQVEPIKCPSVKAIQSTSFIVQKEYGSDNRRYFAIQENQQYDTGWKDGTWTLKVEYIFANTLEEATQVATKSIQSLVYNGGPIKKGNNAWSCLYSNPGLNVLTRAFTDY